jgi:hypothetical protein
MAITRATTVATTAFANIANARATSVVAEPSLARKTRFVVAMGVVASADPEASR